MRQSTLLPAATAALLLSACGPGTLVVTAENEGTDPISGATVNLPLTNLEIILLPYDRDQVFDSLTAAASRPEPEIPQDVLDAQNQIAAAQNQWREVETRWGVLRDTLQKLNTEMSRYTRGEAQYRLLFNDYQTLEAQYTRVENQVTQAFNNYDNLRKASEARAAEVRLQREEWADEAFANAGDIFVLKIRQSGLEVRADTTDANGVATFESVRPGAYWAYARYPLPFSELYWNVPVEVTRGEPIQLLLNRANARERPRL